MVDGTIINTGGGAGIMGMTGGYVADVANAQEVNVQISGRAGRIGNRRRVDQHHPAHRRQSIRRQLLHDLRAGTTTWMARARRRVDQRFVVLQEQQKFLKS